MYKTNELKIFYSNAHIFLKKILTKIYKTQMDYSIVKRKKYQELSFCSCWDIFDEKSVAEHETTEWRSDTS